MRSIDIMRNRRAPATDLQRSVVGTIGKISYDATRLALLGTSQIFKQFMGVAVGSMISNGAVQAPRMLNYFARGFRHMNHPMLNEFNISQRGTILGGFFSEATDVISERGLIKKNVLAKVLDLRKSIGDTIAKPLGAGDAGVARASWWMYYLDYLYKKGVDVNAIDFETIRPDYDAAAYAEQMVSRMQNANDRASMPELYASGDPFLKIMRDFALPFSSFSVNMNRRMANDIDILYNGTSSQKLQAYRSLQSAVVEQFVFNSMKVYLLGSATQAGADLLSDYFEISDDELEKVYKSAYGDTRKTKTEKVIWNSIEDIFMGALPAPVKSGIKEYVNKSYVALTGVDEEWQNGPFYVYRTTDDPDFPSWIDYTGVYGMYGKTIYDVGKMGEMAITGEYEAAEGAKVEMSDNEQRAVMASALIDFAALAGVSDQDVSSINTKLKRQIKKHLGREYGKDIQITVPKKAATIADPFRDVDREVSAERFVRFWNDPETTEQERYNVIKQGVINKRTWTEKAGEGRVSFMDALKKLDRKAYIKVKLLKKKAEREVKLGQ
jgi:RNA-binding protein YhbY